MALILLVLILAILFGGLGFIVPTVTRPGIAAGSARRVNVPGRGPRGQNIRALWHPGARLVPLGAPGCLRFGLVAPGAHALLWSCGPHGQDPERGVPY